MMNQFFTDPQTIQSWLEAHGVHSYTITADLSVSVAGNVNLFERKLEFFPVQFDRVTGHFSCFDNRLKNLLGAPRQSGSFLCFDNQLTSLQGAPHTVQGQFSCSNNQLTSLEFCPQRVSSYFDASHNQISTLRFLPETVGSEFYINENLPLGSCDKLIRLSDLKKLQALELERDMLDQTLAPSAPSKHVILKI